MGVKEGEKGKTRDEPLRTQLEQGRFLAGVSSGGGETLGGWRAAYLSHLSLLFLQGSQLMALRARFVGGRGSWSPGGGLVLERTAPGVRCCFERWAGATEEGDEEEGSVGMVLSSGMMIDDAPPDRAPRCFAFLHFACLFQTLTIRSRDTGPAPQVHCYKEAVAGGVHRRDLIVGHDATTWFPRSSLLGGHVRRGRIYREYLGAHHSREGIRWKK